MTSLEPPGGGGHANHGFNEDDGVRILIANHRHKFRNPHSRLDEIICKNVKIKVMAEVPTLDLYIPSLFVLQFQCIIIVSW